MNTATSDGLDALMLQCFLYGSLALPILRMSHICNVAVAFHCTYMQPEMKIFVNTKLILVLKRHKVETSENELFFLLACII